jgi:hypothetical protein
MALRANFSLEDVRHKFELAAKLFRRTVIKTLKNIGEQSVNIARDRGSYLNKTGNLRSSTGFIILEDGEVITKSGFEKVAGQSVGKVAENGAEVGLNLAETLASQLDEGFVLIVVAGMEYAASVEAKGYDVLTSSEKFAESEIGVLISQLKTQLESRR